MVRLLSMLGYVLVKSAYGSRRSRSHERCAVGPECTDLAQMGDWAAPFFAGQSAAVRRSW